MRASGGPGPDSFRPYAARMNRARTLALLLFLPACGGGAPSGRLELLVHAAISTREPLLALEAGYERAHGVELVFNFGASGDLARQIVAAGAADVFLSADERELERVRAAGLVLEGSERALLASELAIVEPLDAPALLAAPFEARALAQPALTRLALGEVESVPVGRYAKAWLEAQGVWSALEARVVPGVDARAVLAAVESGAVSAGIVYHTDAERSARVRIVHVVPASEGPRIVYPLALIAGRSERQTAAARAFAEHLAAPEARAAFEAAGFAFLPATDG